MKNVLILLICGLVMSTTAYAHAPHARPVPAQVTVSFHWAWVTGHWSHGHYVRGHWAKKPGPGPAVQRQSRQWVPGRYVGHGPRRHWVPGHWRKR